MMPVATPARLSGACAAAVLVVARAALALDGGASETPAREWRAPVLRLVAQDEAPVLTVRSPGAEGIKYGFEGGRALKIGALYHLFTSEMVGDPFWVRMRLGHWSSPDGVAWRRVGTLGESSGDYTGADPRAALWSPIPVYDPAQAVWNLFYVAYRAAPSTDAAWLENFDGRIWRAVSAMGGLGGIDGPYRDVGIVLSPGPDADPWEGGQGTDSFFPFRIGDGWHAFYGSARTESLPIAAWQVGLATAPALSGPWERWSAANPLPIEPRFIENPIVEPLPGGGFIAVYDSGVVDAIGYSVSRDGRSWSSGRALVVQPTPGVWAGEVRTPLGLVAEPDDTYTLFYTGYYRQRDAGPPRSEPDRAGPKVSAVGRTSIVLEAGTP
jgi:hypothetical protein